MNLWKSTDFLIAILTLLSSCAYGDRDLPFQKIFVGFNGPSRVAVVHFESESSAKNSWLSTALTPTELAGVLSKINFQNQLLIAFITGQTVQASGTVIVKRVRQYQIDNGLMVYGRLGINVEDCGNAKLRNVNPFVLIAIERPVNFPPTMSYDLQAFPDECRPSSTDKKGHADE